MLHLCYEWYILKKKKKKLKNKRRAEKDKNYMEEAPWILKTFLNGILTWRFSALLWVFISLSLPPLSLSIYLSLTRSFSRSLALSLSPSLCLDVHSFGCMKTLPSDINHTKTQCTQTETMGNRANIAIDSTIWIGFLSYQCRCDMDASPSITLYAKMDEVEEARMEQRLQNG